MRDPRFRSTHTYAHMCARAHTQNARAHAHPHTHPHTHQHTHEHTHSRTNPATPRRLRTNETLTRCANESLSGGAVPQDSGLLFYGMAAPFANYSVRGWLWYQVRLQRLSSGSRWAL